MYTLIQPVLASEYTGLYDTLIEGQSETQGNGRFEGEDFSTFISTLNSSYWYQSNSFTSKHPTFVDTDGNPHNAGTDEEDYGSGYFSSGPTRTYRYSSGIQMVTVSTNNPTTTGTGVFQGTGYGSGESGTQWDIVGGDTEWSWTAHTWFQGYTSVTPTYGSPTDGSYSTDTFAFGSGPEPPRGKWTSQTTEDSTEYLAQKFSQESTAPWTVPTGTYYVTADSQGNSRTITTTINVTIAVDTITGSETSGSITAQGFVNSFIFDPDNLYLYRTVYVPISNGTSNEWVWVYSQEFPFSFSDPSVVTEAWYSVDGDFYAEPLPSVFPMKILSAFDANDENQTFTCSTINGDITDPISQVEKITSQTYGSDEEPPSTTQTYYWVGQLPMESSTNDGVYQATMMTTDDAGGWIQTDTTFAELASKTIPANSFIYLSFPAIVNYQDQQGRYTTTSYLSIYAHEIPSATDQTVPDYDYIITAYDTYQVPSSGTPVRGGAFWDYEEQSIWGSYSSSGPGIFPADVIFFTQYWPDTSPGVFDAQWGPVITTGFQVPPYIANSDPVYQRVDANAQIDDFGYEFFNGAFVGHEDYDVAIPFQSYYQDETSGETGASTVPGYTFNFASDSMTEDLGQVSVTHQFGATSDTESFIMQLAGGGDTIKYDISAGPRGLYGYDEDGIFYLISLFGGLPRAYGGANAQGGDTVLLDGKFDTSDNEGGSGRQDFNWSFEMATDEITAYRGVGCFYALTASMWQNSSFAARLFASVANKYPDLFGPTVQ